MYTHSYAAGRGANLCVEKSPLLCLNVIKYKKEPPPYCIYTYVHNIVSPYPSVPAPTRVIYMYRCTIIKALLLLFSLFFFSHYYSTPLFTAAREKSTPGKL